MNNKKGKFYILFGPSGAGKTTVCNMITKNKTVTTTTRAPRTGEVEGVHYYFKTKEEFKQMISNDEFIEWAPYGVEPNIQFYGLTKKELEKRLDYGDVFNVCELIGVKHFKKTLPECICIFIYSDFDSIRKQLLDRGGNLDDINERLLKYEEEMKGIKHADFAVENKYGKLTKTIEEIQKLINM